MCDPDRETRAWSNAQGRSDLVRQVRAGHVLGDHSYGHMAHNNRNDARRFPSYADPWADAEYFGERNFQPVGEVMGRAGLPAHLIQKVGLSSVRDGGSQVAVDRQFVIGTVLVLVLPHPTPRPPLGKPDFLQFRSPALYEPLEGASQGILIYTDVVLPNV